MSRFYLKKYQQRPNGTVTLTSMGKNNWKADPETGLKVMPKHWTDLLDWLLLGPERDPLTQREWAKQHELHEDSVRRIKKDSRFLKEWDRRAAELNINPERVQSVIDALWQRAADGDVKAASLYLQYIDKFTPKRKVAVAEDRDVLSMSDSQLADELEATISTLRLVENA